MPDIDDLEVIRELLTEKPPSQDLNDYVKGRLTAVIAAAESHRGAGRRVRRSPCSCRTVAGAAQRRRRRLALRSAARAAAALTATAVALAVVVVPGARHDGTGRPVIDADYVVKHVDNALSTVGPGEIAQMTITTRGGAIPGSTATAEEWSYRGQWRAVTNSPSGHPVYDEGFSASSVYTVVGYLTRTWARQPRTEPVSGPRTCEPAAASAGPKLIPPGLAGIGFPTSPLPANVAGVLRTAISCGTLTLAGRQHVNGIEAIELTSRPDSLISETVWVSPGTYFPVRVIVRSAPGTPVLRQTADITWFKPTAQNLTRLTVPVPAGFRQVPLAKTLQQILGRPLKKSR